MAIQFSTGVEISTAAWRLAQTHQSNVEVLGQGVSDDMGCLKGVNIQ